MVLKQQYGYLNVAIALAVLTSTGCWSESAYAEPIKAAIAAPHRSTESRDQVSHSKASKYSARSTHISRSKLSPISLTASGDDNRVQIATEAAEPKYTIQRLESPPRLVVDIDAEKLTGAGPIEGSSLKYVSRVRVGAHANKTRVVVDLKNSQNVLHTAKVEQGRIIVTLSTSTAPDALVQNEAAVIPSGLKPMDAPKANPIIDSKNSRIAKSASLRLDEDVVVSGSSDVAGSIARVDPKLPEERPENPGARIAKVALEKVGGSSESLIVGVEGSPDFLMTRTAPSEYVLKVRNTNADENVKKHTLFTARDSSGIRSVRTVEQGSDTLIRIFTQPSSYLIARKMGDQLLVEETQDLAEVARDIRAQLSPPANSAGKDANRKPAGPAKKDNAIDPKPAAKKVEEKKNDTGTKDDKDATDSKDSPKSPAKGELAALNGSADTYTGRLISLDLQDADIDSALRIIAEVSNLNIVASDGVTGKVTLKLVDVPWDQALDVILKSNGLDKVVEGNVMRVAPFEKIRLEREAVKQNLVIQEELEPLSVKYMRVSYAKAAEIKALVETVLTERGSVAFDERSNQLIVKDARKGLENVAELVRKIDLRTPQILLETQIVEASRNLRRELGSELGVQYIQSPATGNGTGLNFPSAVSIGGSATGGTLPGSVSAFPIADPVNSAVTMLFDSADGTKNLALRLSQLEEEGVVKVISRPAVATTNNKPAEIKSVTKVRVKLPNGGLSIATGSGAQSSGAGDVAAQTLEAGIILNVTPQASPDYFILLDIKAKSSNFEEEKTEGIPNETERSASSSVLVSSGQTFALGGIYKITERSGVSGVPFFKDIPVLGTFFRSSISSNTDEELLFFITPRIVEGSFEDASMKVNS